MGTSSTGAQARAFLCWTVFCLSLGLTLTGSLATAQAPLAANGSTAKIVEFGYGADKIGEFRLTASKRWTEFQANGVATYRFEETNRDAGIVYLFDRDRSVYLQLDLNARKVMYGEQPTDLFEIYAILAASASQIRVGARQATVIEYGTVGPSSDRKTGEFRQTGVGAWSEYDTDDKLKVRLKELKRDDNSVYLRDCNRGSDVQLDLHTRKVLRQNSSEALSVFGAAAVSVPVPAEYAIRPAAPTSDCGYVIASVEPDGGLRYLQAPAETGTLRQRAVVSREPIRDACTGEVAPDSFWSLIPQYTMKAVPPGGTTPVDAYAMNVVSLRTGRVLQFDADGPMNLTSPFFGKGTAPQLLFVPTGTVDGNTPLTFEVRELKNGVQGRKVLTFDDRATEPAPSMVAVNKPTVDLLAGPDASHYRRNFAVFSPNCPAVGGIASRNANISAEHTQTRMSHWGIQGDMSSITKLAASAYANWPIPYFDLTRVQGNATTPALCPEGTVAVGLGIEGNAGERRTLICRRYSGAAQPQKTSPTKFPIADQGWGKPNGVPHKGDLIAPGAITGLTCGDDRQCSFRYIDGFAGNQCRWMDGPTINYTDTRARDIEGVSRQLLPDRVYRPDGEAWCDRNGEVLAGLSCATELDSPKSEAVDPFCIRLGLKCCNLSGTGYYTGALHSPLGSQDNTTVWSPLYGLDAKLNKNAPNLDCSCPVGYVASGFDCGNGTTSCANKSLGCKKISATDDGGRSEIPRTIDATGAGVYEPGLAITGMRCATPSCREIKLQHVKLKSDGTRGESCRWAPVTNLFASAPSQCTAGEYLADIRCKNGNCSDFVETKCCIDTTGRLTTKRIFEGERGVTMQPPRVPEKPVNSRQVACRDACDNNDVARSLFDCGIGQFSHQECSPAAAVVVGCHLACMIANP